MVSRAHEITKPVLVIADDVIVRAAGGERSVVTGNVFEGVFPPSLLAVTITLQRVLGAIPVKVAEVVVEEEGVTVTPLNV